MVHVAVGADATYQSSADVNMGWTAKCKGLKTLPTDQVLLVLERLVREDRDLDIHTGLEGRRSDLLDNLAGRVQVDQALVDAHLVVIPGLRTLTTRRLAGGVGEDLRRKTDRALHVELLVLRAVDEVIAHLLEALHVTRGERNADLVQLHRGRGINFLVLGDVAHLAIQLGTSGDQVKERRFSGHLPF